LRRGAAHSAVTAGRPNERAVTPSKDPRRAPSRPQASARASATRTRSPSPRRATAPRRKAARRALDSIRVTLADSRADATTRPGSPPPEPRSARTTGPPLLAVGEPHKRRAIVAKPAACCNCGSKGPGPRKPARRASSRISSRAGGSAPSAAAAISSPAR
jgi:hypothetical protein